MASNKGQAVLGFEVGLASGDVPATGNIAYKIDAFVGAIGHNFISN